MNGERRVGIDVQRLMLISFIENLELDLLLSITWNKILSITRPLREKLRISADSSLVLQKVGPFLYNQNHEWNFFEFDRK